MRFLIYHRLLLHVFWVVFSICLYSCEGAHYELFPDPISIDYYIVNCRTEEILVKNRAGANGIIGFFLTSGQVYHYSYHDKIWVRLGHRYPTSSDIEDFEFTFDFYAPGADGAFQEWIGSFTFVPDLKGSLSYVDTCYVY